MVDEQDGYEPFYGKGELLHLTVFLSAVSKDGKYCSDIDCKPVQV